ncbi:hypothetical protein AB0E96_27570 [Kitasatospora sp. NPDC036755]|uniref:hypothetical protein n=1 Tax=Kitasatospora sp. NPDC036755 TaxID=3154600 RepID=UPI0033C8199F
MGAGEGSGGQAVGSVEVRYTPTAADFREARAAWTRHTAEGRRGRRNMYVVASGATVSAGLLALVGGVALLPAVLLAALALLMFTMPRRRVRRVTRMAADKGEFRVLLDGQGVVVSSEESVTQLAWAEQRYFLETPGLFLLMGGDEETRVLTLLPKRGIADVRELCELIDRHATALVPD